MASASAQVIINRAYAMSSANDPGRTATKEELLGVLRARLRVLYNRATRLNPFFSAIFRDISPANGKWTRPEGALRIILIEAAETNGGSNAVLSPGTEVHNVPVEDRIFAELPPRVYRLGNCYYTVGKEGDPDASDTGDILRFYHSDDSPGVADLNACLPLWLPDENEELIVIQLAKYLARKDKARGDLAALQAEEDALLDEFDASVLDADLNVSKRMGRSSGGGLSPPERQGA